MNSDFPLHSLNIQNQQLPLASLTINTFQDFLSQHNLKPLFTTKNFKDSTHYRSQQLGMELEFASSVLATVFLYLAEKGFKRCSYQKLPYSLNFNLKASEIVYTLGEPTRKYGGSKVFIGMTYETLGLDITFSSTVWNPNAQIQSICFFSRNSSEKTCGSCNKKTGAIHSCCGGAIVFCSEVCKQKFQPVHAKYCLSITNS